MRDTEEHNAETAKRASVYCGCGLTEAESTAFLFAIAELRPVDGDQP